MSDPYLDISDTLLAKSDQLNADDLIAGPIVVTIERVTRVDGDQPVAIHISGHQPWKPCKTMRRVLAGMWGRDARQWSGRSLELYRDDTVEWGGAAVGGIRIRAASHLDGRFQVSLQVRKGRKQRYTVEPLATAAPAVDLNALLESAGLFRDDLDAWLVARGKPTTRDQPDRVPALASWLAAHPEALAEMRPAGGEE